MSGSVVRVRVRAEVSLGLRLRAKVRVRLRVRVRLLLPWQAMLPPSNSGLRDPASGRDLSMSWQVRLRPLRPSSFLYPCPLVLALSPPTSHLPPPTAHLAPLTPLASLASRLSPLTSHL